MAAELEPWITVSKIMAKLREIIQAAEVANQCKSECRDLVGKALLLSYTLPLYMQSKDERTRRMLRKFKEALSDALTHVKACKTSGGAAVAPRTSDRVRVSATYIEDCGKALVLVHQSKLLKL